MTDITALGEILINFTPIPAYKTVTAYRMQEERTHE